MTSHHLWWFYRDRDKSSHSFQACNLMSATFVLKGHDLALMLITVSNVCNEVHYNVAEVLRLCMLWEPHDGEAYPSDVLLFYLALNACEEQRAVGDETCRQLLISTWSFDATCSAPAQEMAMGLGLSDLTVERNTKRYWQWWQIPAVLWPLIIRHSAPGVNNMNLSVSWVLLALLKIPSRV